jgi:alkylmercury lyase
VRSRSPLDGDPIALRVTPTRIEDASPPDLLVSMVPARESDDFIRTFCHQIHFFASPAEGERWTAEREGTFLMSLADAFELATRVNHARYGSAVATGR